jgi:hypothetical protein
LWRIIEQRHPDFFEALEVGCRVGAFEHPAEKNQPAEQGGVAVKHGGIFLQVAFKFELIGQPAFDDQTAQLNQVPVAGFACVSHGDFVPFCGQSLGADGHGAALSSGVQNAHQTGESFGETVCRRPSKKTPHQSPATPPTLSGQEREELGHFRARHRPK